MISSLFDNLFLLQNKINFKIVFDLLCIFLRARNKNKEKKVEEWNFARKLNNLS